jgi:hypothetical protein
MRREAAAFGLTLAAVEMTHDGQYAVKVSGRGYAIYKVVR